jgi:hypothetical protein
MFPALTSVAPTFPTVCLQTAVIGLLWLAGFDNQGHNSILPAMPIVDKMPRGVLLIGSVGLE